MIYPTTGPRGALSPLSRVGEGGGLFPPPPPMGPHTATPRDGGGQYIIGDTSVLGGKRRNGRAKTTDSSAVITSGEYKVNIRFGGDPSA